MFLRLTASSAFNASSDIVNSYAEMALGSSATRSDYGSADDQHDMVRCLFEEISLAGSSRWSTDVVEFVCPVAAALSLQAYNMSDAEGTVQR